MTIAEVTELQELEAKHPRWRVTKTGNTWWATFDGPWTLSQENHGCMRQLHAETPDLLAGALAKGDACETCWGRDVAAAGV